MSTQRLPVLFVAHGNPMNALGGTPLAEFLAGWADELPRPRALTCPCWSSVVPREGDRRFATPTQASSTPR